MKNLIAFGLALVLAGCSATKEIHQRVSGLSPQEVIKAVDAHGRQIATFQAKGTISVETPSMMNSGSFQLRIKKPDSVRVDITGPFGIRVASALFAGDHFQFYNSFKNEVIEETIDRGGQLAFMNFPIRPDEAIESFSGTRSFLHNEMSPDSFTHTANAYLLQFRHGGETTRYRVDDETLFITGVEHIDSAGSVWGEEQFEYETRGGNVIPQSLRIVHNTLGSSVALFYDSVLLNEPVQGMMLSIPADARHVTKR